MERILVEEHLKAHPRAQHICGLFPHAQIETISSYLEAFQKKSRWADKGRTPLIIAEKKGELLKEAPELYADTGTHYILVHQYNCLFDCQYCYLQGTFRDPSQVIFINYEEMWEAIMELRKRIEGPLWIYTGDVADSLAMDRCTGFVDYFVPKVLATPDLYMELRTKSNNISSLLKYQGSAQVEVAFSLSPPEIWEAYERGTASPEQRIHAMEQVAAKGYAVGVRLDPIIDQEDLEGRYTTLLKDLFSRVAIRSVSIGSFRMPANVAKTIRKRHPKSSLLAGELVTGTKGFVQYFRPIRKRLYDTVKQIVDTYGAPETCYVCMDTDS